MLKKSLACACLVMMFHAAADAGRVDNVRITSVGPRDDGYFVLSLDQPMAGSPSCATAGPYYVMGNLSTPGGRALFDTATAAYTNTTRIYVEGLGVCVGGIETIFRIIVGAH